MIQAKKPIRLNASNSLKPSVQVKEKRTHSPTCLAGHGALLSKGKRSAALSLVKAEGLQCHSTRSQLLQSSWRS